MAFHYNIIYNDNEDTDDSELALTFVQYLDNKMSVWGFNGYYAAKHAIPGRSVFEELFRIVRETEKTLVVITPHFRSNYWAKYSKQAAFKYLLEEGNQHKLIPIAINIRNKQALEELNVNTPILIKGLTEQEWEDNNKNCFERLKNVFLSEESPLMVEEEECLADNYSREEIIRINMEQHLIYISLCIKPDDLLLYLRCFSEEQKSAILSEKNLIKASRKTLEMLLHNVEEPGRFVELRDALSENDGYPKIVRILDGDCNPKDQNYAKVVELFTRGIIVRLNPSELLPHLLQKGVFKQKDVGEIRAEEKNHGKMKAACVLLMYLPRRIADWFRCFLQVLIKCDLEDIAEMLDTDMFKDIKLSQTNEQRREVTSIKAPQLKFRLSPIKANATTSKMNDNLSSESNVNAETKISGKLDDAIASETELRFMRNDKVASNEEPNAPVLESNSANRNDQTLANEMIHESEPEVYNLKKMQRYTVCEMACGRRITVMTGSLVDLRVDVMVNTTDKALSLTTGLAETISEKGGEKIRTACYKYFQTQGSLDEGEAFVSEAGGLPAKHVVHVNSPIMREGTEDELRLLRQTVMNAMMQASVKNAQTIALPAISCGISGFRPKTATRQIVRAVRNFFREKPSCSLKHVYLVDKYPHIAKRFHEALCYEFEDDTNCVVEALEESL